MRDLHDYGDVGFDVDFSDTIVAREVAETGHLWISDARGDGLTRLTSGSRFRQAKRRRTAGASVGWDRSRMTAAGRPTLEVVCR